MICNNSYIHFPLFHHEQPAPQPINPPKQTKPRPTPYRPRRFHQQNNNLSKTTSLPVQLNPINHPDRVILGPQRQAPEAPTHSKLRTKQQR